MLPIINDLCLTINNNITIENELQSECNHIIFLISLSFYIVTVPQVLAGISIFCLIQFMSIKFILAQGPHTMQGLVISIWYMSNCIYCVHFIMANSTLLICQN